MTAEIGDPGIEYRDEKHSLGIRVQTPFNGMFAVERQLRKELYGWLKAQQIKPDGPFFLRYYVIDMEGEMDIEFGLQVPAPLPGDERVKPGIIPAGRYAFLVYSRYALRGNRALFGWVEQKKLALDRWDDPQGDAFACRCETYLADPRVEPRKTKWDVDLAVKLAE
jgi:effector-binding domain-containing protein